jgi:hypothetical protein
MSPEAGQAWFRIALLITLGSATLAYVTEPGSAERVVSVMTLLIGVVFIGVLAVSIRRSRR